MTGASPSTGSTSTADPEPNPPTSQPSGSFVMYLAT